MINTIKHYGTSLFFLALLLLQVGCSNPYVSKADIVPKLHKSEIKEGIFSLDKKTSIAVSNKELNPLADLLAQKIQHISGLDLKIDNLKSEDHQLVLDLNPNLKEEEYLLNIADDVHIEASNYNSMAMGVATLFQLIHVQNNKLTLPYISISDKPDYAYRTVMLDLARFWHPVETIKETIDLLWFYKVKYLHLHLSDNRRFTFPMDEFPNLKLVDKEGSREYYTIEELKHLVEYAKQRGIAIIPEIDLPGHSNQLWQKYPETFGSVDPKTGKAMPLHVINMAKEETYEACEKIINKLAEVFYTSPYIHFGADEVYLGAIKNVPEYEAFCKKHQLNAALKGDANELFCYFINRMHNMVKATGKKTIIWEGFHGTGAGSQTVDKDIEVIVWNATYNQPDSLVSNGYKIVNATWIPWYFVGAMNLAPSPEKGYNWELTQWLHWDDKIADVEISQNNSTLGGQICYWEQNHYKVMPVLQERVPVFSERLWNNKSNSDYNEFTNRYKHTNTLFTQLFRPIEIVSNDLLSDEDVTFKDKANIKLLNLQDKGKIKYVVSNNWKMPDIDNGNDYKQSFTIEKSSVITAQLYNHKGERIGNPTQKYFQKIEPTYRYRALGPAPNKGWDKMPNFDQLGVLRQGVTGKMTPERLEKINGELFAKVKKKGHIETRFQGLYNQYAVELKAKIKSPTSDEWELKIQTHDGLAELYIADELVAKGKNFKNEPENFTIKIPEGIHPITIKYYYRQIQNQLSIEYKMAAMDDYEPFENLVQPLN